ncbi:MAG: 2-methylaconitate cis-trans isomerase PrpF family protein [Rhodothermales bacterium]
MMQRKIPCTYMRSGTSSGPFLDLRDLPTDSDERNAILFRIMGSPDPRQVDGLGGATPVTSKVVMVQPSQRVGVDVDYLFAQVAIDKPIVDMRPTCGNMMTGVGPFAIEQGWVDIVAGQTTVRVYSLNTGSYIEIEVDTPDRKVNYVDGTTAIDGVPGTGAPIWLNQFDLSGGTTGHLFPTGNRKDKIDGVEVSIVDASNLIMMMHAESFGLDGTEDRPFFQSHPSLMKRFEEIRVEAGVLAGIGDVTNSVLPRIGVLSPPRNDGSIKSQYFTPHVLHPSHAVSGAICIATACKANGTVAADVVEIDSANPDNIVIEHASGRMPVQVSVSDQDPFTVTSARVVRTARKIMDGFVYY